VAGALALVALLAATVTARADDPEQLWVDHAVSSSDHVVRGTAEKGTVHVARSLKGTLAEPTAIVDRDDAEPPADALVPGTTRLSGEAVFFLVGQFDGKGADPRRFMLWEGAQGIAWLGTAALGYRPSSADPDRLEIAVLGSTTAFVAAIDRALERDRALAATIALVDTAARTQGLVAVALAARSGPASIEEELGPDPFATRALLELPRCGAAAIDAIALVRSRTTLAWVKAAAIRSLAAVAGAPEAAARRLEAIAQDPGASEDEVVAAVDMLFHVEAASLDALERLSRDPRPRVRASVAATVREKVKDLTLLSGLMKDPDAHVRAQAWTSARAAARRLGLEDPEPPAKR
jgi:hypothetical protein